MASATIGGAAAVAVGLLHGLATFHNPLWPFDAVVSVAVAYGVGLTAAFGATLGKLRAPRVAASLGALIGALAVYASWITWVHGYAARTGATTWLLEPRALLGGLGRIASAGDAWGTNAWVPPAGILIALWVVEAGMIVALPALFAGTAARAPFCEACGQWVRRAERWWIDAPEAAERLREGLVAGELSALAPRPLALGRPAGEATLSLCPDCGRTGFLRIDSVVVSERRGKPRVERRNLLAGLILTPPALAEARRLAREAPLSSEPPSIPPEPGG